MTAPWSPSAARERAHKRARELQDAGDVEKAQALRAIAALPTDGGPRAYDDPRAWDVAWHGATGENTVEAQTVIDTMRAEADRAAREMRIDPDGPRVFRRDGLSGDDPMTTRLDTTWDHLATRGHWSVTFTGRQFYPLDPRPEDIAIEDIAHALSMLCRFGGHCREFYSVAQHSVLVARSLSGLGPFYRPTSAVATLTPGARALMLWGLLHDGPEAYVGDVIWPLKRAPTMAAAYNPIEHGVMVAIAARFGLSMPEPPPIKVADLRALMTEKRDLLGSVASKVSPTNVEADDARHSGRLAWGADVDPFEATIVPWSPAAAERTFLGLFQDLTT